jgi:hypothetical protein
MTEEQKKLFLKIDTKFQGPANRKKWIPIYADLINWRTENPNSWPQYDKKDLGSEEKKLNTFCQTIRKRYRENDLENYWLEKFLAIGFNFEGHLDNWLAKYEEYKKKVEDEQSISIHKIGKTAYAWLMLQKEKEDALSKTQSDYINVFKKYFKNWDESFEEVKAWILEQNKLPTKTTQRGFHIWLGSQRSVYKNGNLSDQQIESLKSIGYDLEPTGNEKKKDRWLEMYNQLLDFRQLHPDSWPKSGSVGFESQLYNWCQANRQAQAGTGSQGRRKPLRQWQIDKLDKLGFVWNNRANEKTWDEWFSDLSKIVDEQRGLGIPSSINGKKNPLYAWLTKQKYDLKNHNLSKEKIQALKNIGIDLNSNLQSSGHDGFTKWANKIKEIVEFIEKNGYHPKAGKDKEQGKLYDSLARTKRAFINSELSEQQIKLLNELKIEL